MKDMANDLPILVVTLGLALPDKTWVERVIKFECDPEFEDDESFDLQETAANHLMAKNQEEIDRLAPSGWFLIAWEWSDEEDSEERPDRPCDADCARRLAGNDSVECTCSRSKNQVLPSELTFKVDDQIVKVGNDMKVEYEDKEEGRTLIITLTHEGIIMDVWDMCENEPTVTSSITFDEKIEEMLNE